MMQDSTRSIATNVKHFFSGTMISRFTGLAREVAMAAVFGTDPAVAAFWMAFRFAHLLRRLFGEGALHAVFVPHFESIRKKDAIQGARFFYDLSKGVIICLLIIIVFIEIILIAVLHFCELSKSTTEVLRLTQIMMPALVFISLYALNTSLLNCERTFFLPSVAPSALNIVWLIALFFLWQKPVSQAIELLAMIIVFAFAMQWLITMPKVFHYLSCNLARISHTFSGNSHTLTPHLDHQGSEAVSIQHPHCSDSQSRASERRFASKKSEKFGLENKWQTNRFTGRQIFLLIRPFAFGILGVAATQINNGLDAIFARVADPQGPAVLWYALRIQQLPLAIIGVGLTGALLPPISRAVENGMHQYSHFLNFALKKTIMWMLPLTAAVIGLALPGINLIYGHGEFSQPATLETAHCLWAYSLALLPMSIVLILASAFYAQKNYRIPSLLSLVTVVSNLILNTVFVFQFHLGAVSVALATVISAYINSVLLALFLKKKHGLSLERIYLGKLILASTLPIVTTCFFGAYLFHDNIWFSQAVMFPRELSTQTLSFGIQALCFIMTFAVAAYCLRLREFFAFLPKRVSKMGRQQTSFKQEH